jgi:hypothetical protein
MYNLDMTVYRSDPMDPEASCRDYGSQYGYPYCFCTEVQKIFENELGCTPPWIDCKVRDPSFPQHYGYGYGYETCMNPTSHNMTKVGTMLRYLGEYQHTDNCKTSCQSMMIQSTLTNKIKTKDNLLEILINPRVTVVKTRRSNTPMDLLVSLTSALSLWVGWCMINLMEFTAIWLPGKISQIKMKFAVNREPQDILPVDDDSIHPDEQDKNKR